MDSEKLPNIQCMQVHMGSMFAVKLFEEDIILIGGFEHMVDHIKEKLGTFWVIIT